MRHWNHAVSVRFQSHRSVRFYVCLSDNRAISCTVVKANRTWNQQKIVHKSFQSRCKAELHQFEQLHSQKCGATFATLICQITRQVAPVWTEAKWIQNVHLFTSSEWCLMSVGMRTFFICWSHRKCNDLIGRGSGWDRWRVTPNN